MKYYEPSRTVGCYHCLSTFPYSDIVEATPRDNEALCPKCGIDSVTFATRVIDLDRGFNEGFSEAYGYDATELRRRKLEPKIWTVRDFGEGKVRIDFRNYTTDELYHLRKLCKLVNPERHDPAYNFGACYYCKGGRWYEGGPHNFVNNHVVRATEIVI